MATYAELKSKVLSWSNRDIEVLPDSILDDSIRYAADKAYRKLRIPPLEFLANYEMTADQADGRYIPVPADLTEFISLTKLTGGGTSTSCPLVYNQKVDIRTFNDAQASHPQYPFWAREQGKILLSTYPASAEGDRFQLYYYGRQARVMEDNEPNWLRDENERILLFGALMECFAYLGEDDMQAKYIQMFNEEIEELNREEEMRKASGGNTVIQYTSYLI